MVLESCNQRLAGGRKQSPEGLLICYIPGRTPSGRDVDLTLLERFLKRQYDWKESSLSPPWKATSPSLTHPHSTSSPGGSSGPPGAVLESSESPPQDSCTLWSQFCCCVTLGKSLSHCGHSFLSTDKLLSLWYGPPGDSRWVGSAFEEGPVKRKRPWCWEKLKAGGEGDDRGWDGWMASPTRWAWVWVSSGRQWRTGKPGVQQSQRLQRVRHDWVTEQQWRGPHFLRWRITQLPSLLLPLFCTPCFTLQQSLQLDPIQVFPWAELWIHFHLEQMPQTPPQWFYRRRPSTAVCF